jgi:hypothetical protein
LDPRRVFALAWIVNSVYKGIILREYLLRHTDGNSAMTFFLFWYLASWPGSCGILPLVK